VVQIVFTFGSYTNATHSGATQKSLAVAASEAPPSLQRFAHRSGYGIKNSRRADSRGG